MNVVRKNAGMRIAILQIVLAAGTAACLGGGCYNPKVMSGGFACAATTSKRCPDGFECVAGLCVNADGAGGQGGGGTGARGGAAGSCANAIAPQCPISSDAPASCDPVCQNGCPCGQRCTVSAAGVGCAAPMGAKVMGDLCQPTSDQCGPGLVCILENCGTNLGRCYRFCRGASCGAGRVCGTPVKLSTGGPTDQRACNLGDYTCDPLANSGCPDPAFNCYVTAPSRVTCDCPGAISRQSGDACTNFNDCAPGLACLNIGGSSHCYKLCAGASDCPGCMSLGTAGGYCP